MMKKSLVLMTFLLAAPVVWANDELPMSCQQLFDETDLLISEAAAQPGMHPQIEQLKSDFQASKTKILQLSPALQAKSCDKGLLVLNDLKSHSS